MEPLETALAKPEREYLPKLQVERWAKLVGEVVCKGHSDIEVSRMIQRNRERFLRELDDVGVMFCFPPRAGRVSTCMGMWER
jgi:hypothetical protein